MVKELTRERQMIKIQNLTKRKRVRMITVKKYHHDVSKKENLKNYITEHVSFSPVMLDEIVVNINRIISIYSCIWYRTNISFNKLLTSTYAVEDFS